MTLIYWLFRSASFLLFGTFVTQIDDLLASHGFIGVTPIFVVTLVYWRFRSASFSLFGIFVSPTDWWHSDLLVFCWRHNDLLVIYDCKLLSIWNTEYRSGHGTFVTPTDKLKSLFGTYVTRIDSI